MGHGIRFLGKKYAYLRKSTYLEAEAIRILILFKNHQLKFDRPRTFSPAELHEDIAGAIRDHLALDRWAFTKYETVGSWKPIQKLLQEDMNTQNNMEE